MKIIKWFIIFIFGAIYSSIIVQVFIGLMNATAFQGLSGIILFLISFSYILQILVNFNEWFNKQIRK